MHLTSRIAAAFFLVAVCLAWLPSQAADEDPAWFARPGVPERGLAMTNQAPLIGRPVQDSNGVAFAMVSYVLFEPGPGTARYLLASGPNFYGNILLPLTQVRIEETAVHANRPAADLLQERHFGVEEMEKHYDPVNMKEHAPIFPPGLNAQ